MSSLPKSLFKYMSPEGALSALSSKTLRFSNPLSFNDCYESWAKIGPYSKEEVEQLLFQDLRNSMGDIDFKVFIEGNKDNLISQCLSNLENFPNTEIGEQLRNPKHPYNKSRRYRISCFSEKIDNALMWGHYASAGKGCALEFDVEQLSLFFPSMIHKVIYSDTLPDIGPDFKKGILLRLINKGKDWAYEQEWRAITHKDLFDRSNHNKFTQYILSEDRMEEDHLYIKYRNPWLKAVYFGPNSTLEFQHEIQTILQEKYTNILCHTMERDCKLYRFRIKA